MPRATYRDLPFTEKYIRKIENPQQGGAQRGRVQSREDVVDHLWTNIFVHCFQSPRPMTFSMERESYLLRNGRQRTDIAVVNLVGPDEHMQKAAIFEAKRPLGPPNDRQPREAEWKKVTAQLQKNIRPARRADRQTQGMYGVAAIGTWARLYKFPGGERVLKENPALHGAF
ncbi:hypothetical protein BJX76DRAFT_353898 [Aspergillus varians]